MFPLFGQRILTRPTLMVALAGIALGVLTGSFAYDAYHQKANAQVSTQYRYVNPLVNADMPIDQNFSENTALKNQLEAFINSQIKNNANAAVYFRNLDVGTWVAINEKAQFSPGKLLKIPLMIAYYKLAESDPNVLEQKITFAKSKVTNQPIFKPRYPLIIGHTYSVQELIEKMITDTNDDAASLLFDAIDKDALNEIFSDLGITFKENEETQNFIPLKLYSLFFRVLYNATYLNREYSEKALDLLIKADNGIGIGAQLPTNILVANRYGTRSFMQNNTSLQEMYDCGIVYYSANPYLLCAMAQGKNLTQLERFLAELGKLTYQAMGSS